MTDTSRRDDTSFLDAVHTAMREVIDQFARPVSIEATLASITAAAVTLIDGVDSADVLFIDEDNDYRSAAATSPLAENQSHIQREHQQGPCVDAAVGEILVVSDDLRQEARWPDYTAKAVAAGAVGVMSCQLYTHQRRPSCRAALNLFSRTAGAFDPEAQAAAVTLATHAALALVAEDRHAQFQSALASRDAIGQAKGMLMERYRIDAVRAFEMMRRLSQDTNTTIVTLAARIITAGPDLPTPPHS